METGIFDTHAHYDDKQFDEDRQQVIESLKDVICNVVNVGASLEGCKRSVELANEYPFFYAAVGVHPSDCGEMTKEDLDWIESVLSYEKVVAVGEIGLDYYWDDVPRDIQKKWFVSQLEVAAKHNMPVIIHSRDAAADTFEIIREYKERINKMVIHCFSYEKEMAKQYVDMGYYIGIGGVLTFKNARKLCEVARIVPIERILLETDCPYLAPEPNRGTRNNSSNLVYVAKKLAEIKEMDVQDVISITAANARQFYNVV